MLIPVHGSAASTLAALSEVTMRVSRSTMSPLDFEGLKIFDYTAGQSFAASVAAIEVAPGAQHAEAWSRRSDKYYLVTSGEIELVLDGEPVTLRSGDFCFVRQGRRFSYANKGSKLATLVLVHTPCFDLRDEVFVGR